MQKLVWTKIYLNTKTTWKYTNTHTHTRVCVHVQTLAKMKKSVHLIDIHLVCFFFSSE